MVVHVPTIYIQEKVHPKVLIDDLKKVSGDKARESVAEAQKYVLKNIHIGIRLEGLCRKDVPEIAPEALREAVINAFCQRDYRDPGYVQVAIYKDRVEIRNPGGLFGGITLADLRKGHISAITGVTTRSVERNIRKLQEAGVLKRVGPDKGGHWEVLP